MTYFATNTTTNGKILAAAVNNVSNLRWPIYVQRHPSAWVGQRRFDGHPDDVPAGWAGAVHFLRGTDGLPHCGR